MDTHEFLKSVTTFQGGDATITDLYSNHLNMGDKLPRGRAFMRLIKIHERNRIAHRVRERLEYEAYLEENL